MCCIALCDHARRALVVSAHRAFAAPLFHHSGVCVRARVCARHTRSIGERARARLWKNAQCSVLVVIGVRVLLIPMRWTHRGHRVVLCELKEGRTSRKIGDRRGRRERLACRDESLLRLYVKRVPREQMLAGT